MNKKFTLVILLLFLVATNILYVVGFLADGQGKVFSGLIQNPIDGNSYLAKMYQGYLGEWKFHLPYSIEKGEGAYLFLFYIGLGHLSRLLGMPLIAVFHLARLSASVMLFVAIHLFIENRIAAPVFFKRLALILCLFGSGLGWIAFFFDLLPSDIWVSETYPFLAAYTNPHFPLGMALLLFLILNLYREWGFKSFLLQAVLGILLAIIMPFGIVVAAGIMGVANAWSFFAERKIVPTALFALIPGGVFLTYQYVVILRDPILVEWNHQNMTVSPPLWDLILSLSPAFFLAIFGYRKARTALPTETFRLLAGWIVMGMLLIYSPFNLQRRFMFAFYIPFALLAIYGLMEITTRLKIGKRLIYSIAIVASILTNVLVLSAGVFGILGRDLKIYLTLGKQEALQWIAHQTDEDSIVLASSEMGLLIPAHTGRRVLFGHPFETIHAASRKEIVDRFSHGELSGSALQNLIADEGIDYILWTNDEGDDTFPEDRLNLNLVFHNAETKIYGTRQLQ
ncbi:MAG: hypothetical protein IT308_02915 [Anaerolineaceae bacterium]|nr:hypothetical protein [Anaerolineaceae bacterium]